MPRPARSEDPRVQAARTAVRDAESALDAYEAGNPGEQVLDGDGGDAYEKAFIVGLAVGRAHGALRDVHRELADEQEQANRMALNARQNRVIGFRN